MTDAPALSRPGEPELARPQLSARADRLLREVAYVVAGMILGCAYMLLAAAALLAMLLSIAWVGLPLLLVESEIVWRSAALERTLANRLLGARIPPLPALADRAEGSALQRVRLRARSAPLWRATALLALRLPASALLVAVTGAGLALTGALVVLGVEGLAGQNGGSIGPFRLGVPLGIALLALAPPTLIVTGAVGHAMASTLRVLSRTLLGTRLVPGGPVRETLAESLGDSTLSIAYWLPDRGTFVDERGYPVPLPEPGADRAWTAVDYDGKRVAAIIHDANLDAGDDLVQAAAAAASLALDNERLKADLRARVEELRASRVRIVEAADSARRRLERDLHDGAQQQLVALAVDLRILRARVKQHPEAAELIDSIDEKLAAALAELRELARGIHPAILTDRGLGPALDALASRAPLPVRCDVQLDGRVPAPVEAAAYFVVAEATTNVLKYAEASGARVRVREQDDDIVVEVEDDGIGGADASRGSGLRGLHDRVGAVDGTLTVTSPPGAGTLVRARIPCRAGKLVERATGRSQEDG